MQTYLFRGWGCYGVGVDGRTVGVATNRTWVGVGEGTVGGFVAVAIRTVVAVGGDGGAWVACGFLVGVEVGRNGTRVNVAERAAVARAVVVIAAVGALVAVGTGVSVVVGTGDSVAVAIAVPVKTSVGTAVAVISSVGGLVGVEVARRDLIAAIEDSVSAPKMHITTRIINPVPPPIHHFVRLGDWPGFFVVAGMGVWGEAPVRVEMDGGIGVGFGEGGGDAGG